MLNLNKARYRLAVKYGIISHKFARFQLDFYKMPNELYKLFFCKIK